MVKHFSLIAFDAIVLTGKKCPQAVLACLPMSLPVSSAEQLTYLSCWICTAFKAYKRAFAGNFSKSNKG
jgi:hypothetical protein